jgi:hypothetical protein
VRGQVALRILRFGPPLGRYPGLMRFLRASIVLAALTVALAVPLAVLAGGTAKRQSPPTFAFGRTGGNIVPFKVSIGKDGRVTATGPVNVTGTGSPLSLPLRNGLAKLAQAEGFFSMPALISCGGVNPDVAGRFVTVAAGGKSRTVTEHGTCKPAFEELYAVLSAAVGAGQ